MGIPEVVVGYVRRQVVGRGQVPLHPRVRIRAKIYGKKLIYDNYNNIFKVQFNHPPPFSGEILLKNSLLRHRGDTYLFSIKDLVGFQESIR